MLTLEGELQSTRAFVRGLGSRYGDSKVSPAVGRLALVGVALCIMTVVLAR